MTTYPQWAWSGSYDFLKFSEIGDNISKTAQDSVLDAQTQNGDEPVGEYSFPGQSCLSSADSWWNG